MGVSKLDEGQEMNATLSKKQEREQEQESAKDFLRKVFASQERATAWTILKSVSASGMSRDMKVITQYEGRVIDITWYVSHASSVGQLRERNGQRVVRVGGCGMDMGFHLIYSLSIALYGIENAYNLKQEWL
jgi:hypothetical protein